MYEDAISLARESVWNAIATGQGSGATFAIMDKGEIIFEEGFGVANRENNRPVDANTRFNIGSASKMFCAVAALLLVDEGRLGLDEPVAKYIPEFRMKDDRYKKITVRMLFNHSSGIPGSTFAFGYKTDPNSREYMFDSLAGSYLKHEPGAMSIYCNDGFTLAEILVEKVSGQGYIEFLTKRVFRPLGMKNSGPSVGEMKGDNFAEYYDAKTGKKYPPETIMQYAAGGLSSTASDMCRFGASFTPYGKNILSGSSLKEILKTQPTPFSDKLRGRQVISEFGWDYSSIPSYQRKGYQLAAKSGGSYCYTTNLQIVPEKGVVVFFSMSGNVGNVEGVTRPVVDAVMRAVKYIGPVVRSVEKPVEPKPIPRDFLSFEGYYTNGAKVVKVSFDMEKNKCDIIQLAGIKDAKAAVHGPVPFLSLIYNDGSFFCEEAKMQLYFTNIDGRSYIVQDNIPIYESNELLFQKIDEIKTSVQLKKNLDAKIWLPRNLKPFTLGRIIKLTTSSVYGELPGYVNFNGLKTVVDTEYAHTAATSFRDQYDLRLFDKAGETWAASSMFLYSPAEGAKKAVDGVNRLFIGKEGLNEWLTIEKGKILEFERPSDGRILVMTASDTLYDSIAGPSETLTSGGIYVPAGSFVFCAGKAGDMFRIEAR